MATSGNKGSKVSTVPPRKINVQKFVEARAPELQSLQSIVARSLNNDYRSQRNKRRRTTAHDNQAAKKRHRKRQKSEIIDKGNSLDVEKDKKRVPRHVRRRLELKKNPENGFSTSRDGTKWLRTHVWHAKRFALTKLWGFHLPLGEQGRGKGSRALLKRFKRGVVLHDASYYVPLQLDGPEDALISVLNMVVVPPPSAYSKDIAGSIISGHMYGNAMLHYAGAPISKPIAPVTYMWRRPLHLHNVENNSSIENSDGCNEGKSSGSCNRQLWVWLHPSSSKEGYDALTFACQKQMNESGIQINCLSLEGHLAKLDVMGSKAFNLLQKALRPICCKSSELNECSETGLKSMSKEWSLLGNEDNIYSHSMHSLVVQDPRTLPKNKTENVPAEGAFHVPPSLPEDEVKRVIDLPSDLEANLPSAPDESCDSSGSKNVWDVRDGICPPFEESVLCSKKWSSRMDFLFLHDPKSGNKPSTEEKRSWSCPILLLKNSGRMGFQLGWSIILPLCWVRVFWNCLLSKGAQAIGLREKRWIACEVALPHFPSDFPDCFAYSTYMAAEAIALDEKAERTPNAVRSTKVPIPPPWNTICVSRKSFVQDTRTSIDEEMDECIPSTPASSEFLNPCHVYSFNGIVARTPIMLADFLKDTCHNHLPLFPQTPDSKAGFLEWIKDESMDAFPQNGTSHATCHHGLCFVRVILHAYKEGFFEEGAIVCAPVPDDIAMWASRTRTSEDGLQISQSSVKSYFKELSPGKWELQIPEDPAGKESHRWPIGFITTGFVRGSKKLAATAFCDAVLLAQLREKQWSEVPREKRRKEILVLVRNLRSSAYRLALATIVLEHQEEDAEFL